MAGSLVYVVRYVAVVAFVLFAVVYAFARIYGVRLRILSQHIAVVMIVVAVAVAAVFAPLASGVYGFWFNGTHLTLRIAFGPSFELRDVSGCDLEWVSIEGRGVFRVYGFGVPDLVMGRVAVEGVGDGVGFVRLPSRWALFIRCGSETYILAAPGLRPWGGR